MAEEREGEIPRIDVDSAAQGGVELKADDLTQQDLVEQHRLDGESKVRESYLTDQDQARNIRENVVWLAIGVIVFMGVLLVADLVLTYLGLPDGTPDSIRVALFVTPVVSMTTITIFLLVGAFRGFKQKDFDNLPLNAVVAEMGKAAIRYR